MEQPISESRRLVRLEVISCLQTISNRFLGEVIRKGDISAGIDLLESIELLETFSMNANGIPRQIDHGVITPSEGERLIDLDSIIMKMAFDLNAVNVEQHAIDWVNHPLFAKLSSSAQIALDEMELDGQGNTS